MSAPPKPGTTPFSVDKCLVLLHDCLAIKFVPLVSSLSYNHKNKINHSNSNNGCDSLTHSKCTCCDCTVHVKDPRHINDNKKDNHPSQCSMNPCPVRQQSAYRYFQTHTTKKNLTDTTHGLFLYKEFIQVNSGWNNAVTETLNSLEYKGYLKPGTILVTSGSSRYLNVLKTAYSRKMIHTVPGYRIHWIGEIEEMIADPIQKSHFVPLADALSYCIYEITSSGREAFVDSILTELGKTFTTMVQPSRELVYETLEKLTRARAVYQTAQGYFIVTPDTHRYIISCDETSLLNKVVDTSAAAAVKQKRLHTIPGNVFLPTDDNSDSHASYFVERKNSLRADGNEAQECDINDCSNDEFKRSGSLRFFPRKEHSSAKFSRSRSLSLRVSRNKKGDAGTHITNDSINTLEKGMKNLMNDNDKSGAKTIKPRKRTSFLSRLLTFRRSSTKARKSSTTKKPTSSKPPVFGSQKKSPNPPSESISTQTSFSMENLNVESVNVETVINASSSTAEDSDSGRYTESSSDAEITAAFAGSPLLPTKQKDVQTRKDELSTPGWSINDPVYEKLRSQSSLSQFSLRNDIDGDNSCENNNKNISDCESSTTKDYGKSSSTSSSSPCPSTTISDRSTSSLSSYRDLYNFYRRRHHTYKSPNSSTQPARKPNVPSSAPTSRPKLHEMRHNFRKVLPQKLLSVDNSSSSTEPRYKCESKSETTSNSTSTTTTTVTQTVKSDSNVELELLLPLEKLINAALLAQRERATTAKEKSNSYSGNNNDNSKIKVDSSSTSGFRSELVANVNDLFSIRSHVSISPDDAMSSMIEIKTKTLPKVVESISVKPSEFKEDCRESEIL